jgi:hypothetical protein
MKDGRFGDTMQQMQFCENEVLTRDLVAPPGVDVHAAPVRPAAADPAAADPAAADPAAAPAPAAPAQVPPSEAEFEAAFKIFFTNRITTLKKHHTHCTPAEIKEIGRGLWGDQPIAKRMEFVAKVRAKAAAVAAGAGGRARAFAVDVGARALTTATLIAAGATTTTPAERTIRVGCRVPNILVGRHKGLKYILHERGLLPAGLKIACQTEKDHKDTNDCCCARLLSVQPDFAAETSALQQVIETRIPVPSSSTLAIPIPADMTMARHVCLFLPKVRPPLPPPAHHAQLIALFVRAPCSPCAADCLVCARPLLTMRS